MATSNHYKNCLTAEPESHFRQLGFELFWGGPKKAASDPPYWPSDVFVMEQDPDPFFPLQDKNITGVRYFFVRHLKIEMLSRRIHIWIC